MSRAREAGLTSRRQPEGCDLYIREEPPLGGPRRSPVQRLHAEGVAGVGGDRGPAAAVPRKRGQPCHQAARSGRGRSLASECHASIVQ